MTLIIKHLVKHVEETSRILDIPILKH